GSSASCSIAVLVAIFLADNGHDTATSPPFSLLSLPVIANPQGEAIHDTMPAGRYQLTRPRGCLSPLDCRATAWLAMAERIGPTARVIELVVIAARLEQRVGYSRFSAVFTASISARSRPWARPLKGKVRRANDCSSGSSPCGSPLSCWTKPPPAQIS